MAQSFARLWTHLIFSTKNRFPFLSDKVLRAEMHAYLAEMLRTHGCETLIVGGVEDHAHALFALSRTLPIANVVKEIKRTSSGWIKETARKLAKFHWQGGYAAFSVSQSNLQDVIRYIENQEEHGFASKLKDHCWMRSVPPAVAGGSTRRTRNCY